MPYKGAADVARDLAGGQVDIFITPYGPSLIELIKQGKLKAVAALSQQRQPAIPDVPTTAESKALKNFQYQIGSGYFVKRGTPEAVVQVLHKGLQKVLVDPEVKAALEAGGSNVSPAQTLAEADTAFKQETATYQAIAKSIGLVQP